MDHESLLSQNRLETYFIPPINFQSCVYTQNVADLADRVEKQLEYHRRTLSPKTDPLAVIGGFLAFVGVLAAVPLDFFLAVVTLGFPIICVFLIGFFGMNLVERFKEIVEDVDQKNRLRSDGKNGCFSFVYYSLASERTFKLFQPHYLSIYIYILTFFIASIFFIVWVVRLTPIPSQVLLTYIVLAILPLLFALAIIAESGSIKHIKFDHELHLNRSSGKWTRIQSIYETISQLQYNLDIIDKIRSIER